MTASPRVLHWGKHLHTMQWFASQGRHVGVLLKTCFPESLGAPDVAKLALSTSILVNYTWRERFWEFVFEGEKGRKSNTRFEHDFQIAERDIFLEGFYQFIFCFPRHWPKKWEDDHVQFWNCMDNILLFEEFVEEGRHTLVNKFWWIPIFRKYVLEFLDLLMEGEIRWVDHISTIQKSWNQAPFVRIRHERTEVSIYSRERYFSMHRRGKPTGVSEDGHIQELWIIVPSWGFISPISQISSLLLL